MLQDRLPRDEGIGLKRFLDPVGFQSQTSAGLLARRMLRIGKWLSGRSLRNGQNISGQSPKSTSLLRKLTLGASILFVLSAAVTATGLAYFINTLGRTPREWAPFLLHHAEGHRPLITKTTAFVAGLLVRMDRIHRDNAGTTLTWVGAAGGAADSGKVTPGDIHYHLVGSLESLTSALNAAEPGDTIELAPGHYIVRGYYGLKIARPGRPDAPITLRASHLGEVEIDGAVTALFKISAPYWHIENLVLHGSCTPDQDSVCEHAIQIVGKAKGTEIRNNLLEDFNAQIKINGEAGEFPDDGIVDHNTLTDTRPRATANPVTPIDLDAANGWVMTHNLITDFIKNGGNNVSYGAFAKAASENNVFERNVVLCEDRLVGHLGQRIGISLGGGGSMESIRRDSGQSGVEQFNSRISDNLIAFCSDVGIYLNRAKDSVIQHNTLLDTSGILARYPQSSAEIEGNIVDGVIAARDGATIHEESNLHASLIGLFVGLHPQRSLFTDVAHLDLSWRGTPPRDPNPDVQMDLCGAARAVQPVFGAFEDFATCMRRGALR